MIMLADDTLKQASQCTRCFIKGPLFLSFIIHSNDDQFTQKFLAVVAEKILIQNILRKFGS